MRKKDLNEKIVLHSFYVTILFFIPIIVMVFHLIDREEIVNDFNQNKDLVCDINGIIINVSKYNKWFIEDYYFKKADTKIVITDCSIKDIK